MIPPRRLLVATDFSAGAQLAADTAIALAERWQAEIDWLHVCPEASHSLTPSGSALLRHYLDQDRNEARDALDALLKQAGDRGVGGSVQLEDGRPGEVAAACAQELGSDWLVVGTHGRSALQALLLGSVAEKMIRNSPIASLAVRPGERLTAGCTVLYGDDFVHDEGRSAAAELCRSLDAKLVLVHAIEWGAGLALASSPAPPLALIDESRKEALARLEELAERLDADVESLVYIGPAAVALCETARGRNASLIVTGRSTRSALERWMLGGAAEGVLRHAPCSVLTLQ